MKWNRRLMVLACALSLATSACLSGGGGSSSGDGDGDVGDGDGDVGDGDGDGDADAGDPVALCRQGCVLAVDCEIEGFDQSECDAACEEAYQDAVQAGCGPNWVEALTCQVAEFACEPTGMECESERSDFADCIVDE